MPGRGVARLLLCTTLQLISWTKLAHSGAVSSNPELVDIDSYFRPDSCDKKAQRGKRLSMHYKGWYNVDGSEDTIFGQSRQQDGKGKPLEFTLGKGEVIKGWENGVAGMCIGEKRTVIIPPLLAFGDTGGGGHIPARATLKLDLELLNVTDIVDDSHMSKEHTKSMKKFFESVDYNEDGKLSPEEMYNYMTHFGEGGNTAAEELLTILHGESFKESDKDGDGMLTFSEWHSEPGHEEL